MTTVKTALVTGANRGIGLETARQLAEKGLDVIATVRSLSQAAVTGIGNSRLAGQH
jgi:NAD(P)-dependent dehydrogenase (short-subunit alcohol dehydrogenase family)